MNTSKFKKGLSLLLAIIMTFTMIPTSLYALGADESLPMIKAFTSLTGDYHAYRTQIVTATFLDEIDTTGALYSWDVSADGDGSVMAWLKENTAETVAAGVERYDVFIGGNGGVCANPNSNDLFFGFTVLKEINGLENFDTSNVVTFMYTFQQCKALEYLDLSSFDTSGVQSFLWMFTDCQALKSLNLNGWNTSSATNMNSMFKNCYALTTLDISSFDTHNVTDMANMFYKCQNLETLYIGDGWAVDQVTSSNAMFNCCYAIKGEKTYNDPSISYPHDKKYATTEYFVTYKAPETKKQYIVTYSFVGENIPEGVTPPDPAVYDEGSTVSVKADAEAQGWEFSGWTTTDAQVSDSEFVINNDVHFVGSWSKYYNVTYKYTPGYLVPDDAPAAEMLETLSSVHTAGEDVDVAGVMFAGGYVFIGWYTEDAQIVGDMFTMPEKDVTIYGYFKKPVESVEFTYAEDNIVLNSGESEKLNVYVKPEDATVKEIIFESDNDSVVKVDKYGNIEAVGPGTATITVKSADDDTKSDTITVTVKNPVTDIETDKTNIIINKGDTDKITTTVVPENATNKKIIYESGDDSIVTVDENGNLVAVGEGKTTITVKSDDNNDIKETVTVTVKIPVKEITVPEKEIVVELDCEDEVNIGAQVNSDATNKVLIYDSENSSVAKVGSDGTIIPIGEGETTVIVKSQDNPDIYETVRVTVIKKYKVTYEFIGEIIPDGVTAPEAQEHINGSTVTVEADAAAAGYVFSGWSTSDAVVADSKFVIGNDVHFVGSWSRLYNVTYEYEGEVPADAPALPDKEAYEAGESVDVKAAPVVEGYTFSGWVTSDAVVADGEFTMPEKDVVLKGRFEKIPVKYNVTYEYEGEVPADAPALPDKEAYEAGESVGVKAAPAVDGYTFSGWTTSDAAVTDGKFTMPEKDVVLKGRFEKIPVKYNVTYEYEGEVPADAPALPDKEAYEAGESVGVKAAPTVDGYTFSGWTTSDAAVADGKFTMPEKDVVLKGSFEKTVIKVEKVQADKDDITLTVGDAEKITVTVTPDKATDKEVTFESANENIVKVDENGNIVAVGPGVTTITITAKDGSGKSDTVKVTVNRPQVNVDEVKADKEEITLEIGQTDKITATVTPDDATNKDVMYETSDRYIVQVDENGNLVAVGEGTAIITVRSKDDHSKSDTVKVTVKKPYAPVTNIIADKKVTVVLGEEKDVGARVDDNATNKGLTYESDNEAVVKVDSNGKLISVSEGTAQVTVRSVENPAIYAVITVEVTARPASDRKHYMVFGKTEKIGWYNVSLDGGETFLLVFGNSHLEVEHGQEVIIKANDVFGDPFTFYINGNAVTPDENGYVRVIVDKYVLVGALGIPVVAPDAEESLNFIQRLFKAIKDFFAKIASWFKR